MYQRVRAPDGAINPSIIKRLADGAFVPCAEENADWRAYQAWLAEGGTPEDAEPLPRAPIVVTAAQLLRALDQSGDLAAVDAAAKAAGGLTKLLWERAATFDRSDPFIASIGTAIGKTPEQIDAIFLAAREIT